MIFVTLEYLRGQYCMGSAHLQYGMKLLADISASRRRSVMAPKVLGDADDFAHNALIDAFARMGIQSAFFGHMPAQMCHDPRSTN